MFHCTIAGKKMVLNTAQFLLAFASFLAFVIYAIYLISIAYGQYFQVNSALVGVLICLFAIGVEIRGKSYSMLPKYLVAPLMLVVSAAAFLIHGIYMDSGFFDLGILLVFVVANIGMILKGKA